MLQRSPLGRFVFLAEARALSAGDERRLAVRLEDRLRGRVANEGAVAAELLAGLLPVLRQALEADPERRLSDARKLFAACQAARRRVEEATGERADAAVQGEKAAPARKRARIWPVLAAVVGMLGLAGLCAVGGLAWKGRSMIPADIGDADAVPAPVVPPATTVAPPVVKLQPQPPTPQPPPRPPKPVPVATCQASLKLRVRCLGAVPTVQIDGAPLAYGGATFACAQPYALEADVGGTVCGRARLMVRAHAGSTDAWDVYADATPLPLTGSTVRVQFNAAGNLSAQK